MREKIRKALLPLAALLALASLLMPAGASAAIQNNVCHGANDLSITASDSTATCPDETSTFEKIIREVLIFLSVIVGFVAVVMIIIGGLRYISSGGNSEAVGKAKNTIIYALIGLVIVALAQVIVQFVLNKAENPTSNPSCVKGKLDSGPAKGKSC